MNHSIFSIRSLILGLSMLASSMASAELVLPDQDYEGEDGNGDFVSLSVRKLPEAEGSALAMLYTAHRTNIALYLVEPITPGSVYSMSRYGVSEDGGMIPKADLRLTLRINGKMEDGMPGFTISEDGGNHFTARFEEGDDTRHRWERMVHGQFENVKDHDQKLSVSPLDGPNQQSSAIFTGGPLAGAFAFRRQTDNFYVAYRTTTTESGIRTEDQPRAIVVRIKSTLCEDRHIFFADPYTGQIIAEYAVD